MNINNKNAEESLGKVIQRLRQASKLSLGDLAEQSGVSKSIISQIERNESNPTLSTIRKLSTALDTDINSLLNNEDHPAFIGKLTKNATPLIRSEDGLFELKVIGPVELVEYVQWYEVTARSGGVLESDPHQPGSVEHLTVISGELRVSIDGETKLVKSGETLRYHADKYHVITNPFSETTIALMVLVFIQ